MKRAWPHLSVNRTACKLRMQVKELIELLEADGWYQVRMKGSHRQFHHPTKKGTVTVAGKPNVDIPPGTLNSALKQAGLKKEK
jgi:predicted RNA binding protein YcfA (HicA-like mRNA interferase family)